MKKQSNKGINFTSHSFETKAPSSVKSEKINCIPASFKGKKSK